MLKHEHHDDLTKYSFASIPTLFLPVLAYYDIQGCLSLTPETVFGGYENRHITVQRTSLSVCYLATENFPKHQSYAIIINVSYMDPCIWIFGFAPSVSLRHAACERQWNWLQLHVYIHPILSIVVVVLLNNMQKPDDLTAATINNKILRGL